MSNRADETTKRTWETIDYIGGGFVLQRLMEATVEKKYSYSPRTGDENLNHAEVVDVEPLFGVETTGNRRPRVSRVEQKHRVVHISELKGVEMGELVQEVEERGGLK